MWRLIENSYFWLCYKTQTKELIVRFLHPLKSEVTVLRLHFSSEKIKLIGDEPKWEKIQLLEKRKRDVTKEWDRRMKANATEAKLKQVEKELAEVKEKLHALKKQHD